MHSRRPALCRHIENHLRKNAAHKHLVLLLNKCDLIPTWATAKWVKHLSKEYPTLAFHASLTNSFGKGALINLLRQFSQVRPLTRICTAQSAVAELRCVATWYTRCARTRACVNWPLCDCDGCGCCRRWQLHKDKKNISVGFVGYPNVGKSSIINTLKGKKTCNVAPIPGETKIWQYVTLMRRVFLVDCPGVVYHYNENDAGDSVLKGVIRVEKIEDPDEYAHLVVGRVRRQYLDRMYGITTEWQQPEQFLEAMAHRFGKLKKGGDPDTEVVARMVLNHWQRGKIPWFEPPPGAHEERGGASAATVAAAAAVADNGAPAEAGATLGDDGAEDEEQPAAPSQPEVGGQHFSKIVEQHTYDDDEDQKLSAGKQAEVAAEEQGIIDWDEVYNENEEAFDMMQGTRCCLCLRLRAKSRMRARAPPLTRSGTTHTVLCVADEEKEEGATAAQAGAPGAAVAATTRGLGLNNESLEGGAYDVASVPRNPTKIPVIEVR